MTLAQLRDTGALAPRNGKHGSRLGFLRVNLLAPRKPRRTRAPLRHSGTRAVELLKLRQRRFGCVWSLVSRRQVAFLWRLRALALAWCGGHSCGLLGHRGRELRRRGGELGLGLGLRCCRGRKRLAQRLELVASLHVFGRAVQPPLDVFDATALKLELRSAQLVFKRLQTVQNLGFASACAPHVEAQVRGLLQGRTLLHVASTGLRCAQGAKTVVASFATL